MCVCLFRIIYLPVLFLSLCTNVNFAIDTGYLKNSHVSPSCLLKNLMNGYNSLSLNSDN